MADTQISTDVQAPQEDLGRRRALDRAIDATEGRAPAKTNGNDDALSLQDAASAYGAKLAARRAEENDLRSAYERAAGLVEHQPESVEEKIDRLTAAVENAPHRQAEVAVREEQHATISQNLIETSAVAQQWQQYIQGVLAHEEKQMLDTWGPMSTEEMALAFQEHETFRTDVKNAQARIAQAQLAGREAQDQYIAAFQQAAAAHDRIFGEAFPDLVQDPSAMVAAADGVKQMLQAAGYSQEEIHAGYNFGVGRLNNIRDYRVQSMLLENWRHQEAERRFAEAKPRPLPPVTQRPGSSRGVNAVTYDALAGLSRRLSETGSLRDAARLHAAQLKNRRG